MGYERRRAGDVALAASLLRLSVDFFVGLVAAHLANGVFEHDVLLEEVVDGYFAFGIVVHRALEEEAEEALYAMTAGASSEVTQENEVEAEGSGRGN